MKYITKAIIVIQVFIIIALCLTAYTYNQRMQMLKNRTETLEMQLGIKNIEVRDLKSELTGTYQELENLQINYAANQLFTKELKARFWKIKTYANLAEYMLVERGIEFRQVD